MRIVRNPRFPRALLTATALGALPFACPPGAIAQETATPTPAPAPTPPKDDKADDKNVIIVIADRAIVAALKDVPVERTYDEQDVSSYDVSTVGELLGEIRAENGDADPALLINGEPVADAGNISDIPVEAIQRVEALPRGAAQRVNGAAGQRAYNVVLRQSVKSATLTGSREMATEGGWANSKGEALLTYIKGQDRIGVTVRGARSGTLFESERDFAPRTLTTPYSPTGNIVPYSGTEVDPALSLLAGEPVTTVALPAGVTMPTLAQLLAGANDINPADDSAFRSLRGSASPNDLSVAGNKVLAPWLSLQVNGRMGWTDNDNFSGLPSARFLIPATNAFTPFTVPVYIAVSDPTRPLTSHSSGSSQSLSSALNATFGEWRATLSGRWDHRRQRYTSEFTGPLGGLATVGDATNPFAGTLAGLIPVSERVSRSRNSATAFTFDAEGPLFDAWAGPLRARAGGGASWVSYDASDTLGDRSFDRHEYLAKAGVSIPLTSRSAGFLPALGDSQIALDVGRVDLGRFGTLSRNSIEFEWQVIEWLRFVASRVRDERAIAPELLAAPQVISSNVPYFDPVTGDTVDVTTIYGGGEGLKNEDFRTTTLSLTATPWRKYNLQLDADYIIGDLRNQIGALPPPSAAVVAAFPDRFVRDSTGTLILVDNRSVNFARQDSEQLRLSARFTVPLIAAGKATGVGKDRHRTPPLKLQVNASHSYLFKNRTVIRDGLPEIDLLDGGAIGFGGGQQRHSTNASIALTRGGSGLRAEIRNRGVNRLVIGTTAVPDLLTYHPLTTIDLKAFADLGQHFPGSAIAKGARLTLAFDNIANERQRVTNLAGEIPQAYQPVRRDPVGRTVMIELRKVF